MLEHAYYIRAVSDQARDWNTFFWEERKLFSNTTILVVRVAVVIRIFLVHRIYHKAIYLFFLFSLPSLSFPFLPSFFFFFFFPFPPYP